jgi:Divergent InlB B-repeat domain
MRKRNEMNTRSRVKWALFAAACLGALVIPAAAGTRGPDTFGYTANDRATYSFVDIRSTGGTSALAGADDDQVTVNIGFPFTFYGQNYTSVCINSNGLLLLGSCNASYAAASFANVDLASAAAPGNQPVIAAYWTDLTFGVAGAGSAYYQLLGTTPGTRRFVVEWSQAFPQNGTSGVTFEAILYEGTNQILLQYSNTTVGVTAFDKGASATAGIRGTASGQNLEWSFDSAVISNQSAIQFLPPAASYSLTTAVNPPGAGTISGGGVFPAGSVQQLTATPASGYNFTSWSGDASGSANPVSVSMGSNRYVVANFQASAGTPQLSLTPGAHSDGTAPGTRVIQFTLTNGGNGTAAGAAITGITGITTVGGSGSVTVASTLPVAAGDIAPGQSGTAAVTFNWPATATRVRMTIRFGANAGSYTSSTTITMTR